MSATEQPVVLVVDQDESTRLLFTGALTDAGFEVAAAADGAGALAVMRDRLVGVVLLDNRVVAMAGRQIIDRLQAEAGNRLLEVVLVAGDATDVVETVAGMDAGASDFVVKPVDLVTLVARVRVHVRVKESDKRARRILETTTDAFVSFDAGDLITDWTPHAERLFGWSEAEAIGRPFGRTLLAPQHRAGHEFGVGRFFDVGDQPLLGEWVEVMGLHRDGHELPIEIAEWGLVRNGRRNINASIRKLPMRRRGEQGLRQANPDGTRFAAIPDGVMLCDPVGSILYVSPVVEERLGWRPDQLLGTLRQDLVHPDDRTAGAEYAAALVAGSEVTGECRLRGSDGGYVWMEFTARPIHDRVTREMIGVRSVAHPITERLAAEAERVLMAEQLQDANAQLTAALVREHQMIDDLHELDRMKSNFVAQVSHEVRTPLTSIVGYVELMRESRIDDLHPEYQKMLSVIERNARRLTGMIEDLLTVGDIEADAFSITPVLLDLKPIIEAAAHAVERTAALRGIDLSADVSREMGLVRADAFHIERVLLHLLSNALKFTPTGGRIGISARRTDDEVLVSVSDTGVGIPAAEQARIFDRFYRCERSIEEEVQGAGMGLAISKAVVERHGGTIGVGSAPGEGTTLTVTLPGVSRAEAHAA